MYQHLLTRRVSIFLICKPNNIPPCCTASHFIDSLPFNIIMGRLHQNGKRPCSRIRIINYQWSLVWAKSFGATIPHNYLHDLFRPFWTLNEPIGQSGKFYRRTLANKLNSLHRSTTRSQTEEKLNRLQIPPINETEWDDPPGNEHFYTGAWNLMVRTTFRKYFEKENLDVLNNFSIEILRLEA